MGKKYVVHLSIIAVLLSVIALGGTLFQNWNKEWDSVMFAVAMLSGLVMILIGWNIYTLFDANKFKEDIKKDVASLEEKHEALKMESSMYTLRTNATLFDAVSTFYKKEKKGSREYLYTYFTIESINVHSKLNNIEVALVRIDNLLTIIPTFLPIENEDKLFLISSLTKAESIQNKEYQEKMNLLNLALLEWGENLDK